MLKLLYNSYIVSHIIRTPISLNGAATDKLIWTGNTSAYYTVSQGYTILMEQVQYNLDHPPDVQTRMDSTTEVSTTFQSNYVSFAFKQSFSSFKENSEGVSSKL